jgi:hypothetical protein
VDLQNDTYNCGACGNSCGWLSGNRGSRCSGGVCQYPCYSGYQDCDGQSSNGCEAYISGDIANCGTCGMACSAGQYCYYGMCRACPSGQTACGNTCVSLLSDPYNCGACGVGCGAYFPNASSTCVAGSCALSCSVGYLDCDGNAITGCEVSAISVSNCGACGVACKSGEICSGAGKCTACSPIALGSSLPATVTGTTVGKPNLFMTSCSYGNAPDVAYSFTAPAAGAYTFDTAGSAFDTALEIRDGTCSGAIRGCDASSPISVTVSLNAGQMVVVILDGRDLAQGTYVLNVH